MGCKHRGLFPHDALKAVAEMVGIIGPLAAMYGRDIEQFLMRNDRPTLVPENKFNESVRLGKYTLRLDALASYQDQSMASNQSDSDVRSSRRESRRY